MADSNSGVPLTFADLAVGIAVGSSAGLARHGSAALRVLAPAGRVPVRLVVSVADRVGLGRLHADSRAARAAALTAARDLFGTVVRGVLDAVLDQVDLTGLVEQRVDLDRIARHLDVDGIAARLDLDGIAARLDLDAVLARLDLIALANEVVDGIDLPRIIRESTGSVASEGIAGVRIRSMEADRAVTHVVDRILFRRARSGPHPDGSRPWSGEVDPLGPDRDPLVGPPADSGRP